MVGIKSRKKDRWYQTLKWGDAFVYVSVISLAVFLLSTFGRMNTSNPAYAVLSLDGEPVIQIEAADLEEEGSIEFESRGFSYIIEYSQGRARFARADCPDLICVHTGWISRTGELSACVPGRLVLRIQSDRTGVADSDDLDAVVR